MTEVRNVYRISENLKGRDHLGDPDVVVEIILKLILKIQDLCGLD
jgi:hypothetical protein